MTRMSKLAAVLVVGLTSVLLTRVADPTQVLPAPAQRFVQCYRALGASEARVNGLQRVLFSLAMASAPQPQSTTATTTSSF